MKRVCWLLFVSLLISLAACSRDPKVVCKKYVDNGNKYFDRGRFKEASIMYRRALTKDMRYGDAWYHLGLTNMKLQNYGEARRDFSRAMEIEPGNTDAIVKLADIDLIYYILDPQANRFLMQDLKDLTQQLLKKDPKSFDGLRFSGYIALTQKDFKTAIEKFEAANQTKPDQPELVLSLVQALFATQQRDKAVQYGKTLIDKQKTYGPIYDLLYLYYVQTNQPDVAEALLKQKTQNNPTQGPYLLQLAFHYYMTGRKPEMDATLQRLTSDSKTFPDNHMQAGDFFVRIRDFDSALQQYDLGQKENRKNKRAYQKKMVEVLATQGKRDQASKIVAALLKEDSKDPEAIAMHATLLLQTGDRRQIKAVIAELQPLVSRMPGNATLHLNLGRAYMVAGDPQSQEQARMQFLEALKIEAKNIPARLALAELQTTRGEHAKAVQTAEEVLAIDQTNQIARLIRATALMNMSEFGRAREELTTVLKMYPKSNDARYQLATLDFVERRYKEAEGEFQILMQTNDPRGLAGVMDARIGQGRWSEAIKFAEDELRKTPDRADYRRALAAIYLRAGKYPEAVASFQVLIDKNPKSAELYVLMGECKRFGHDANGAIDAFKKAKDLDPNSYLPSLELGLVFGDLGRIEDARKAYEDVIRLQPDNAEALNNLAYIKADTGQDLDQALAYAQRAQQKRPNDPDIVDTLALIYIRKNLTDDSVRMLRDLVSQKPDSPTYHLHLAMALYQKGDRPTAKKELEKALGHKPNDKEQIEIKQLMAKVG